MKKIILGLTLLLALSLTLTGCNNKKDKRDINDVLKGLKHFEEIDESDIELDKNIPNNVTQEDIHNAHIIYISEVLACFDFVANNSFPEDGIITEEQFLKAMDHTLELYDRADKEILSKYGNHITNTETALYHLVGLHLSFNEQDLKEDKTNYKETDYLKLFAEVIEDSDNKEEELNLIISPSGKYYKMVQDLDYCTDVYLDMYFRSKEQYDKLLYK